MEALFQGRFQPPTIAHMCTVETILAHWQSLVICVIYNSPKPEWFDPRWDSYINESARTSYAPGKNPFTSDEVKEMWDAAIHSRNLYGRIQCATSKRPYFDKEFHVKYPPERFTLIRTHSGDSDTTIDRVRGDIFPELLGRGFVVVKPPFKLHNTEIAKKVLKGGSTWKEFLPTGAYEVFLHIKGPERMEEAYKVRSKG